jgi:hypothetical protein
MLKLPRNQLAAKAIAADCVFSDFFKFHFFPFAEAGVAA